MFCPNRECPDFISTGKPGEYREGITVCPYCQTELVAEDPSRSPRPESPRAAVNHDDRVSVRFKTGCRGIQT